MWHVSFRSGVATLRTAIHLLLTYLLTYCVMSSRFYGAEVDDSEDKRLVQRLVDWLSGRGYSAHSLVLFQRLNPDYWYGWPEDIFWQHRDADPFL